VPRRIDDDDDDEPPRRRKRGARAVAVEAEEERGLLMRIFLHSPKDVVAGLLAGGAIIAIITNALFLQAGRHPSPMFGSVVTLPAPQAAVANPLPRPRPVELEPPETKPAEVRAVAGNSEPRHIEIKSTDSRNSDAVGNLVVKSTGAPAAAPANAMRPPAPIPATTQSTGARRVAAVQRALTQYGYGQLKPTGAVGADTQTAIAKFERDRKLPVTGQMSDRLVRELGAMIGHSIE
jgi:Putative peptidoglycan binding domain